MENFIRGRTESCADNLGKQQYYGRVMPKGKKGDCAAQTDEDRKWLQ